MYVIRHELGSAGINLNKVYAVKAIASVETIVSASCFTFEERCSILCEAAHVSPFALIGDFLCCSRGIDSNLSKSV